jgi:putative ABC transport system permease protein
MLLVGAGLLIQSFVRLRSASPGFRAEGVLTARLQLLDAKYPDDTTRLVFFREALARLRALPGVRHAAMAYPLPLSGANISFFFTAEGQRPAKPGQGPRASLRLVSPDYFQTMGIPVLEGRPFGDQDDLHGMPAVIVNRALAAEIWPGQTPVGKRITLDDPAAPAAKWLTVVGVVAGVRGTSLRREPEMEAYWPQFQQPDSRAVLVVRAPPDPRGLAKAIRRTFKGLDPNLPLDKVLAMDTVVASSLGQSRVNALLLGAFAALALALAAVGLYGVISQLVSQRVHEIGVRMALGAGRGAVVRMIVGQGMVVVAIGLAFGFAGVWAARGLVRDQLYGIGAGDAPTSVVMLVVVAVVSMLANWAPAHRATRIDPARTLRVE